MDPTCIYALFDPRDGRLRYIGKADDPSKRLTEHLREHKNNHRSHWLQSVKRDGFRPMLAIIERCSTDKWQEREMFWIAEFRRLGHDLVNGTDGGDGMFNPSEETRRKLSEARRKRVTKDETRRKIGDFNRGKKRPPRSDEWKRKISEGKIGKKIKPHAFTEEHKANISLGRIGMKFSDEHKRNIGLAGIGRHPSEEAVKNMRRAQAGHKPTRIGKLTEETKRKISIAHTGKTHTEETKKKMSDAHRRNKRAKELIQIVRNNLEVFLVKQPE